MNASLSSAAAAIFPLLMLSAVADPATKPGTDAEEKFVALFPQDGEPKGWKTALWSDVSQPAPAGVSWAVKDGVLRAGAERGCWLVSEKEYADFILVYEFKLGPQGNSGCALRAPAAGDPAFDGMELQMADFRYNEKAKPSELTGGLYRAAAPSVQVYKPEEWNSMRIELRGPAVKVTLNGTLIQDISLDHFAEKVLRHDGKDAPPLKDRPRKGRIGFQQLSRGNSEVMIRGAKILELP